jgi:hypothetical protein
LRVWRVQCDGRDESVEADELEITGSGALVFYRSASRMQQERTLLTAFPPGAWQRCTLQSEPSR